MNPSLYYMKSVVAGGVAGPASETRWTPNTDVYVAEDGIVIKVELAGIRREDLELSVEGMRLLINGHRPDCCRSPKCHFLMMEINCGHFESVIELPPGYDLGKARASYLNGFLRIDVPPLAGPPQNIAVLPEKEK